MSKVFLIVLMISGMVITPLLAQQGAPAPSAASPAPGAKLSKAKPMNDEEGIKKLFEGFSQTWASGDAHSLASNWVKDGSLINPFGQEAWNREDIENILAADTQKLKGSTPAFSDYKFRFILNFALVDCTATFSGLKKADGSDSADQTFHVYSALALRDGRWYILALRPYNLVTLPQDAPMTAPTSIPAATGSVPAMDSVKTPAASSKIVPSTVETPSTMSIPSPDLPVPPGK